MSDLQYNIVNNGNNALETALNKVNVMEGIALRQRHKLETLEQLIRQRVDKIVAGKFDPLVEEEFLYTLLHLIEESENEGDKR